MSHQLNVIVTPELTLDAGRWEAVEYSRGDLIRIVHPPARTMHAQVVDYLTGYDTQDSRTTATCSLPQQAIALTNICLRWGSYFAVLTDSYKPLYPQAKGEAYRRLSHLSDGELARINIEASAALAYWLDLRQTDLNRYMVLVSRALALLPTTSQSIGSWPENMAFQRLGRWIVDNPDEVKRLRLKWPEQAAEAARHPGRVLANALIHYSWRNGSGVEGIHAGQPGGYPLSCRRVRAWDERRLFLETAKRMAEGLVTLESLVTAPGHWGEKVAPFNLCPFIAPRGWTVTAETHPFRLFGDEPG